MSEFPHLTDEGDVHMVDVSGKAVTDRTAVAECVVGLGPTTADALFGGTLPKGDALASIRLAGIMGAKRTPDLIPLCHPILLSGVTVDVERSEEGARITARVTTSGQTGVEMEAMTAVSVAALALYDMVKGVDRSVEIGPIRLIHKSGGRSGEWNRSGI
jgi:cyclic pyranopterin phosphate synthase